jgi:hypothetical protein
VLVAGAGAAVVAFAGGFVVAGAQPGPGGQLRGGAEERGWVGADLADHPAADSGPMPGAVVSRSRAARKGVIIVSICAFSLVIIASR